MQNNKASDMDWFRLESNKEGTKWFGKCWYVHNLLKYEFDVAFDVRTIWRDPGYPGQCNLIHHIPVLPDTCDIPSHCP